MSSVCTNCWVSNVDAKEVDDALARLGFELIDRAQSANGVIWTIRAPSHRFDIDREADLVEEVCRIYGYNRIPSRRPSTRLTLRQVPEGSLRGRSIEGAVRSTRLSGSHHLQLR